MAYDPEAIQAALYDRLVSSLTAAGLIKKATRRDFSFADFPGDFMPAMTVVKESGAAKITPNAPSVWTIETEVTFFVKDPTDKTQTVETTLHALIAGVDAALARQPDEFNDDDGESTTLGGLVTTCRRTDEALGHWGNNSGVAGAAMKIRITANP